MDRQRRSRARAGAGAAVVVLGFLGLMAAACGGGLPTYDQKDRWEEIDALWAKNPKSQDWNLSMDKREVIPHGDSDGPQSYEQKYYVFYGSKKVKGFSMVSFIDIPPDDSRSLGERVNGYFDLATSRVEQLPDSEGFMKLVAKEHKDLALVNIVEDGTLVQKYPGKRVYRLRGRDWEDLPTDTDSGEDDETDWASVFKDPNSGPVVGYDQATKKWVTLESGK